MASAENRTSRAVTAALPVVLWVIIAVVLFGLRYWAAHDESVYIAKALGGRDPFIWRPHRSLGIPALLSPATGLGFGVTASRVSILIFNAAAVGLAFWLWIGILGRWVIVGPTAVLLSWLGLTNATALLPNLPTAVVLLATVAAFWSAVTRPSRSNRALTLVGFVLIGLLRPTALLWITLGIAAAIGLDPVVRRQFRQILVLLALALPTALLVWSVEAVLTFGINPLERVRVGRRAIASFDHDDVVLTLLRNLSHPFGTDTTSLVIVAAALIAGAALLVVAFDNLEGTRRGALTVVTSVGLSKILAYVIFPSDASGRFLIAGLLCTSVGVGVGLRTVVAGHRWRVTAVAVPLAFALIWQVSMADQNAQAVERSRSAMSAAVTTIRKISDSSSCSFASNVSFPSFYLGTSCSGGRAVDPVESMRTMEGRPDVTHSFLVWKGRVEPRDHWQLVDIGAEARFRLYHFVNEADG